MSGNIIYESIPSVLSSGWARDLWLNREQKESHKDIESKTLGGHLEEVKSQVVDGIEVGIVEGYIATWDLDRGNGWVRDQFVKGAFRKSIRDHKKRGRPLRLKDHHGRTIGGFPAESLKEDDRGLYGVGQINLEVQQGKEAYSMAKQGVLTDFSVGFSVVKSNRDEQSDIRTITEAVLWEGSIVDEPMNPEANIVTVKSKEGTDMEDVTEEEVKDFTKRDLEKALRDGRGFTKQAAILVASLFKGQLTEEEKQAEADKKKKARLAAEAEEEANLKSLVDSINETKAAISK